MTGMITDSGQILDEIGHARQGPEGGLIAAGSGASQKSFGNLLGLLGGEFSFGSRWPFARQGGFASLFPGLLPTVSHLPGDRQAAGHFRRSMTFGKQSRGLIAPLLQLDMVSCLRHAQTIPQFLTLVTLLCESQ